jgi:hypothetical protein
MCNVRSYFTYGVKPKPMMVCFSLATFLQLSCQNAMTLRAMRRCSLPVAEPLRVLSSACGCRPSRGCYSCVLLIHGAVQSMLHRLQNYEPVQHCILLAPVVHAMGKLYPSLLQLCCSVQVLSSPQSDGCRSYEQILHPVRKAHHLFCIALRQLPSCRIPCAALAVRQTCPFAVSDVP